MNHHHHRHHRARPQNRRLFISHIAMFLESTHKRTVLVLCVFCLLLYVVVDSLRFISSSSYVNFPTLFFDHNLNNLSFPVSDEDRLEKVLKKAVMKDGTVIITTLNEAWAAPNSVFDLFLESFRIGEQTMELLNHLVIVAMDQKAYGRCMELHSHCFALVTDGVDFREEAYYMTPAYLKMMWRRIDFLRSVLEMGYNFVFTDADVMWFRNPFPRFYLDADFQIACDNFIGSSVDLDNSPNGGFNFVKSNNKSIAFYKFWYSSQDDYPGHHDQDVLNIIKYDRFIADLGLEMRFLDTAFFGGFCEPSRDLNLVCTMHANCCFGLESKLHDLKIMLQDWRVFSSLPPSLKRSPLVSWRVPQNCSLDALYHYNNTNQTAATTEITEVGHERIE